MGDFPSDIVIRDPTNPLYRLAIDVNGKIGVSSLPAVTANAGTNLNTSLLALEAGNLATIAGKDFATQVTLAALNAKLVSGTDIGDVTINNAAGAAAVHIQDGGNAITVDGSVSAAVAGTLTQSTKHDSKVYQYKFGDITATGLLSLAKAANMVIKVHHYSLQSTVDGVTCYFYEETSTTQLSKKWILNAREAQESPFVHAPACLFKCAVTNKDMGINIAGGASPHIYWEVVYSVDDAS